MPTYIMTCRWGHDFEIRNETPAKVTMIRSRLEFTAAVGLVVVGLGFMPREVPGAAPTARAFEHPSSRDVGVENTVLVRENARPQPAAKAEAQPNFLAFGSVRVGATVEGSVRIFRETANARGLAVKFEPPPFVRVDDLKVRARIRTQFQRPL